MDFDPTDPNQRLRDALKKQADAQASFKAKNYSPEAMAALPKRVRPIALVDRGVMRHGMEIFRNGEMIGWVTSGTSIPYFMTEGEGADAREVTYYVYNNVKYTAETHTVTITAQNGDTRTYTITATRRGSSYSDVYNVSATTVTGIGTGSSVDFLLSNMHFGENSTVVVNAADGSVKTGTTAVGTGDTLRVTLPDGSLLVLQIIIYGDTSGDGYISNSDRIKVRNHILGTAPLSGAFLTAADVNRDGKISNSDRILIRNHILGTGTVYQ